MADAYWLEQIEADVPAGNHWLCPSEQLRLAQLRFTKRRTDWRLGRWTAKRAIAACLNLSGEHHALEDIAIKAAPSGAPEVFIFDRKAGVEISISHRAGKAFCVVGLSGVRLGCDLELIEQRDPSFVADFFTKKEQNLISRSSPNERPFLATLMWSAKESALKAMATGLRLDTAILDVSLSDSPKSPTDPQPGDHTFWSPLSVRRTGQQVNRGWWRSDNNMVRTVVFHHSHDAAGVPEKVPILA